MRKGLLIALLFILLLPATVYASDISDARFYGIILIENADEEATGVSTVASISTPNLIDGGYTNSDADNCAMLNTAGEDVAFMPGYDTNPWAMFVPSIGESALFNYLLYTADSTGGKIRYFPGNNGMTMADQGNDFEFGNNFLIQQAGYVDTSDGSDKYLVYKEGAFKSYITEGEITSTIINSVENTSQTLSDALYTGSITRAGQKIASFPASTVTQVSFYLGKYGSPTGTASIRIRKVSDDSIIGTAGTLDVSTLTTGLAWKDFTTPISISSSQDVRFLVEYSGGDINNNIRVGYSTAAISGSRTTYNAGYTDDGASDCTIKIYYDIVSVTATGVGSGEHTVKTAADGTRLYIYIDGEQKANVLLSGASVPNNGNSWSFLTNGSMPYMEYQSVYISEVQVQRIEWEYDSTFHDSINDYDVTPSFRTTSTDADVTATLSSFQPVEEAKAPAFTIGEGSSLIDAPEIEGEFRTETTATFPGASVIEDLAEAGETPAQLPLILIVSFGILVISLGLSYFLKRYGSGSVLVKTAVITVCLILAIITSVYDIWMAFLFIVMAVTWSMASRQVWS